MCLPLKFIQLFIRINCFCFIILGIVLISQVFVTLSQGVSSDGEGIVFTFSVGLAVVIVGASGLLSSYCPNFCIIFIYSCFIIFIGVLTAYITISLTILKNQLHLNYLLLRKQRSKFYGRKLNFVNMTAFVISRKSKTGILTTWRIIAYIIQPIDKSVIQHNIKNAKSGLKLMELHILTLHIWRKNIVVLDGANLIQSTFFQTSIMGSHACYPYFEQEYEYYVNKSYIDYLIVDFLYLFNLCFAICQCYQTSRNKKSRIYPQILYELAPQ
ncbi:unnamed protein product (macronuclear) [Paramecium tetraurelia]|uniref:Tetraspanin n=1 Tax=Paramecium tetraurelia TaxID=5888 RepID=A0EI08_PARTE|nr:uncharacterized protein GSPATT00027276001 [Paramecium tetraurelia]CAK94949.1 unnamed protein product [Paramecium tetraurelia]|eukprot:XP_001462322.1 hypothetical protein (macronuclear) [Paramecium tetraurelia strain d4-2]